VLIRLSRWGRVLAARCRDVRLDLPLIQLPVRVRPPEATARWKGWRVGTHVPGGLCAGEWRGRQAAPGWGGSGPALHRMQREVRCAAQQLSTQAASCHSMFVSNAVNCPLPPTHDATPPHPAHAHVLQAPFTTGSAAPLPTSSTCGMRSAPWPWTWLPLPAPLERPSWKWAPGRAWKLWLQPLSRQCGGSSKGRRQRGQQKRRQQRANLCSQVMPEVGWRSRCYRQLDETSCCKVASIWCPRPSL